MEGAIANTVSTLVSPLLEKALDISISKIAEHLFNGIEGNKGEKIDKKVLEEVEKEIVKQIEAELDPEIKPVVTEAVEKQESSLKKKIEVDIEDIELGLRKAVSEISLEIKKAFHYIESEITHKGKAEEKIWDEMLCVWEENREKQAISVGRNRPAVLSGMCLSVVGEDKVGLDGGR